MTDISVQDTQVGSRIANLLGNLGDRIGASERAEVDLFLRAAEYGLALDTLSWILVEENKPIDPATLREIDGLAEVMAMGREPFIHALHQAAEQQVMHSG